MVAAGLFAFADTVLGIDLPRPAGSGILLVAAVLAVGVVRHFPLPVLAVEAALFTISYVWVPTATAPPALFGLVALTLVAYRHRWQVAAGAAAAVFALQLVVLSRSGNALLDGPGGGLRTIVLAMTAATPVILGCYLRGLREAARLATERAEDAEHRRRAEAGHARLAERARIAGDLHDIVAHHVSAIALQAGSGHYAATQAADRDQRLDEAVLALSTIRDDALQTLSELRALLRVLRDPLDNDAADPETMIVEAVRRTRSAGLHVEAKIDEGTAGTTPVVRMAAARAVQEALTNALKHAGPGADVLAVVRVDDACVRVDVTDSGAIGNRPSLPSSGHGLAGMRERVDELGGTLAAGPTPHGGWRLAVSLPLRAPA